MTRFVATICAMVMVCWTARPLVQDLDRSAFWPTWRGPEGTGVASGKPPVTWSDTTNVQWKIPIAGRGFSTPVAWGDRLFLTTAIPAKDTVASSEVPHRLDVIAIDRHSGRVIWQRTAATVVPHEGYHRVYGSYASHAPATDGQRLYAFFGSRGLFVYDLDGRLLWQKQFGLQMKMRLGFGEGTGVALHHGRLYLVFDHQEPGFIVALDATTGRELWRAPRNDASSWSTPVVVEHKGARQLVVTAETKVRGYDVESGKVIWEVEGLSLNPIPQPIQHGDTVIVMSGYRAPKLMAIRLGRTGDLTGTDAVVWQSTRGTSYTATPALHDNRLYVISDTGLMTVFNAGTGEPHYLQQRLPNAYNFKASPLVANGHVYLASEEGDVVVLKAGDQYAVVSVNTLSDQSFIASPVSVGDDLFLRSRTHLFRIASSPAASQ